MAPRRIGRLKRVWTSEGAAKVSQRWQSIREQRDEGFLGAGRQRNRPSTMANGSAVKFSPLSATLGEMELIVTKTNAGSVAFALLALAGFPGVRGQTCCDPGPPPTCQTGSPVLDDCVWICEPRSPIILNVDGLGWDLTDAQTAYGSTSSATGAGSNCPGPPRARPTPSWPWTAATMDQSAATICSETLRLSRPVR